VESDVPADFGQMVEVRAMTCVMTTVECSVDGRADSALVLVGLGQSSTESAHEIY